MTSSQPPTRDPSTPSFLGLKTDSVSSGAPSGALSLSPTAGPLMMDDNPMLVRGNVLSQMQRDDVQCCGEFRSDGHCARHHAQKNDRTRPLQYGTALCYEKIKIREFQVTSRDTRCAFSETDHIQPLQGPRRYDFAVAVPKQRVQAWLAKDTRRRLRGFPDYSSTVQWSLLGGSYQSFHMYSMCQRIISRLGATSPSDSRAVSTLRRCDECRIAPPAGTRNKFHRPSSVDWTLPPFCADSREITSTSTLARRPKSCGQ